MLVERLQLVSDFIMLSAAKHTRYDAVALEITDGSPLEIDVCLIEQHHGIPLIRSPEVS
jgi:hypothetical protein